MEALRRGSLVIIKQGTTGRNLTLTVFEVVNKYVKTLTLGAIILDDNAGAADNFARVTLLVDLAKTSPLSKNLRVTDLDEVDLVFGTEGINQLDVFSLTAGLDEDTQMSLTFIESLGGFTKTTGEPTVSESSLQDLL